MASSSAWCVAERAGSSVSESEPMWKMRLLRMMRSSISSGRSWVSAPGLRAKEKLRSPCSSKATKARVVKKSGSVMRPSQLTPLDVSVPRRNSPCMSLPILPIKAVSKPMRWRATSTLAGAPPALRSKSFWPPSETPASVKSIRTSPKAVTLIIATPSLDEKGRPSDGRPSYGT